MLGNLVGNQKSSEFFNKNTGGQQQQPTGVPGVPGGLPPVTQQPQQQQPQQQPNTQQPPVNQAPANNTEDLKAELEKYKPTDDNNGTGGDNSSSEEEGFKLPGTEDFNKFAGQLAQRVSIDEEQATAALGGDVTAFNTLLNKMVTDVIGLTMQSSASASLQMYNTMQESSTTKVAKSVQDSGVKSEALTLASNVDPSLSSDPLRTKLFETAFSDLRTSYPTAPTELLAKYAMQSLGIKDKQEEDNSQNNSRFPENSQEIDWTKHGQR